MKETSIARYIPISKTTTAVHSRRSHGGVRSKGRHKTARPLPEGGWLHLALKSDKAYGVHSMARASHRQKVEEVVRSKARRCGVRIAEYVNRGNQLHMKLRVSSRPRFQSFLRAVTTILARLVTGARRGIKFGRFWQGLAFTRVLKSAREELELQSYLRALKKKPAVSTRAQVQSLRDFNLWLYQLRILERMSTA